MTREKIEKTVQGLKACASCPEWYEDCQAQNCPYLEESPPGNINCTNILARDALALLEQMAQDIGINGGCFATQESRERMKMARMVIQRVTARSTPENGGEG